MPLDILLWSDNGQKEKEDHRGKPLKENPNIERRSTPWENI